MTSSTAAFDFRGLHVAEVASQPLEALVAQDNHAIVTATAAIRQDTAAVEIANAIVITDETYGEAERQTVQWKLAIKEAQRIFDPVCASAFETHRRATTARATVIDPLNQACGILSRKLGEHLAAAHLAQQEADRLRLDAAKQQALEQRDQEIESAELNGATVHEVAALCAMPLQPAALISYAPRRTGAPSSPVSLRTTYRAKVINHLALIQHIASHPQFVNLIPVDSAALNKLAGALKTTLMLPGVEVYTENGTSTRTAARKG